jgi:hypothetical protein
MIAMRLRFIEALLVALLFVAPARAENPIPNANLQEILIKSSLLTFNDASLTGNYAVMHARLAKLFRDRISPERLKAAFKVFNEQKINLALIVAMPPVATSAPKINQHGALVLQGYFDTKPSRLTYELYFLPSEGEWKLAEIDVKVRPAEAK